MIIRLIAHWKRRRALLSIRHSMAFFGHPLNGMTDEEIETAVNQLSEIVAQMGVTAQQISDAFANDVQFSSY